MSSPVPAAPAAGPYAANTPAPIIDPSPMKTASPSPSRRSSDAGDAVTALIELHRGRDAAPGLGDLVVGRRRHGVLPRHQLVATHVEPAEGPRHEPDVE